MFDDFYAALHRVKPAETTYRKITLNEAQILFDEMKGLKSLRSDFNADGCIQRSGLIQELLEQRRIAHGFITTDIMPKGKWLVHSATFAQLDDPEADEDIILFDIANQDRPTFLHEFKNLYDPVVYRTDGFMLRRPTETLLNNLHQKVRDCSPA